MIDCPTSYFWNGLQCTAVYSYGKGPCISDFSCSTGLICNQNSALCTCPYTMSLWSNQTNTCSYNYKGCFFSCLNQTLCDFTQTNVILITGTVTTGLFLLELDDCLNLCYSYSYSYAHMQFSSNIYRLDLFSIN